ncbi:hypothetical protein D3C83_300510 [compost metagenome]
MRQEHDEESAGEGQGADDHVPHRHHDTAAGPDDLRAERDLQADEPDQQEAARAHPCRQGFFPP